MKDDMSFVYLIVRSLLQMRSVFSERKTVSNLIKLRKYIFQYRWKKWKSAILLGSVPYSLPKQMVASPLRLRVNRTSKRWISLISLGKNCPVLRESQLGFWEHIYVRMVRDVLAQTRGRRRRCCWQRRVAASAGNCLGRRSCLGAPFLCANAFPRRFDLFWSIRRRDRCGISGFLWVSGRRQHIPRSRRWPWDSWVWIQGFSTMLLLLPWKYVLNNAARFSSNPKKMRVKSRDMKMPFWSMASPN